MKIKDLIKTWSPITGCRPISEGCRNCYAKRMATRLRGRFGYPADEPFRVTYHFDRLDQPLKWRKPRMIFVCSMGDLFHGQVPFESINQIIKIITLCKQHTFLILTKRPKRMAEYFKHLEYLLQIVGESRLPIPNLWLGVTAENQQRADERIPVLLQIPAVVRFVSAEPMLGPVNLKLSDYAISGDSHSVRRAFLNWVICGAETGPGARTMGLSWARDLRDQCKEAGVPFFFKRATGETPDDLMIREYPKGG